ncbi:unnamed protein product [Absidia cylindrospora]
MDWKKPEDQKVLPFPSFSACRVSSGSMQYWWCRLFGFSSQYMDLRDVPLWSLCWTTILGLLVYYEEDEKPRLAANGCYQ